MRQRRAPLILLLFLVATTARAQVDMGASVTPDTFGFGDEKSKKQALPPIEPLALATSLAFDSTTWQQISFSTATAEELTGFMRRGYYKLELFQMLLLAKKSGASIKTLDAERLKGDRLRDMAVRRKLDYDAIYDESLKLDREVEDRWLPSIMTVSVSTDPFRSPRPSKSSRP